MEVPIYHRKEITCYSMVSPEDYDNVMELKWRLHPRGYAISTTTNQLMHRYIISPQPGMYVDHINHNKLDNRRSNLRQVTPRMNMANRVINKNNKTGIKGVHKFRDKYRVYVGKSYIGVFDTAESAASAYKEAFDKHFKS